MRLARFLPHRLQTMAPEAIAFVVIGMGNLLLYALIYNALIFIGAVKSTVIATLVTTYLAYLANRHWTYKDRPRSAVRREYTLFFGVNMVGLLIQAAGNGVVKYGFGLSERGHWLAFNLATGVCICIATAFRFWTYRTFVFKDAPVLAELDVPADADAGAGDPAAERMLPIVAPAEGIPIPAQGRHVSTDLVDTELAELTSEAEFEQLAATLEAELKAGENPAEDAARTH